MTVEYDKSFEKALSKIKDKMLLARIEKAIIKAEAAVSIEKLANTKKLIGFSKYYRIKMGDYRLGFESINKNKIRLIIIEHRKDIYKRFP